MKRFLTSIYFIPALWIVWAGYYYGRLVRRDALVSYDSTTGRRIVEEWNGKTYVPIAPDIYGDAFYAFLTLVTVIWISLGVIKLIIRFFVQTVHEETQKIKEESK